MCSAGFGEHPPRADVPQAPGGEVLGKRQLPSPGPNHLPARPSYGLVHAVTVPHWDGLRVRRRRERPRGHVALGWLTGARRLSGSTWDVRGPAGPPQATVT